MSRRTWHDIDYDTRYLKIHVLAKPLDIFWLKSLDLLNILGDRIVDPGFLDFRHLDFLKLPKILPKICQFELFFMKILGNIFSFKRFARFLENSTKFFNFFAKKIFQKKILKKLDKKSSKFDQKIPAPNFFFGSFDPQNKRHFGWNSENRSFWEKKVFLISILEKCKKSILSPILEKKIKKRFF